MAHLVYELSFKGVASATLASAFDDCTMSSRSGVTVLRSTVADQAALQGLIARIHALGLELLEIHLAAEPNEDETWTSP